MITSNFYLVAAYGVVAVVLLGVSSFYLWRNITLARRIKTLSPPHSSQQTNRQMPLLLRLLPFICFVLLVAVIVMTLMTMNQEKVSSSADIMLQRPAPEIDLPLLGSLSKEEEKIFFTAPTKGRVTLVNFWASWCAPCRVEHPLLVKIAQDSRLDLIGINYKDKIENALHFLTQLGNPFTLIAVDERGRGAIEWGVYGIPETYLVNKQGIIIYRHIGPLTPTLVEEKLLPAINAALL